MLQTIATYREERVKTYGFQIAGDMALFEVKLGAQGIDSFGEKFLSLAEFHPVFHLVAAHRTIDSPFVLYILIPAQEEKNFLKQILLTGEFEESKTILVTSPVDLIYFQGPHYGDRYGVAKTALNTLAQASIPVLMTACSQSCIYLVLPGAMGPKARRSLAEVFEIPRKPPSSH
ncbi:MAG: hypothetical protein JRJ29_15280 [Deltaproteobacteria bacterium]|nr:hypothetical protein [Deltaproteobacteria bacterium]